MLKNPFYQMMKRIFYFLLLLSALVACEDDDSFSSSGGLMLTFETDTLKMDTVFSKSASSTYSFWVHNHHRRISHSIHYIYYTFTLIGICYYLTM